jgi:hypothetical protein
LTDVYTVYGITLYSSIPLDLPTRGQGTLGEIQLRTATASFFADAVRGVPLGQLDGSWYEFAHFSDGASYARWDGVGEFFVSGNGRLVLCRQFDAATTESFQVYLLGQALSFALVQSGFEPLHATCVVIDGDAVAFLGNSGFGKSTLAACFLQSGYRILTDDLLLLQTNSGQVVAYPGPARIKLFPPDARRFLGSESRSVPMNTATQKLIIPLDGERRWLTPVPLRVVYSLSRSDDTDSSTIRVEPLSPRQAFLELLKNTFNRRIVDPSRLMRQIQNASRLAGLLPVRRVSFPWISSRVPAIQEAILFDLSSQASEISACVN